MADKNMRDESREQYTLGHSGNATREDLWTGALLRIADAAEKMAANYTALQDSLDFYKREYQNRGQAMNGLLRTIHSLRGYITRLKKQGKP